MNLTGSITGTNVTTGGNAIITEGPTGSIGGSGVTFIHSSSGTSVLSGVNSYTGDTTVNAGALQIAGAGQLGSGNYPGNISLASGTTLQYSSSANQSLSGPITGPASSSFIKDTGTGTLTVDNLLSFNGGVTVNAGTLALGSTNSIGNAGLNVGVGATANFQGAVNQFGATQIWNVSGTVTNTGTASVFLANPVNLTNGGTLSGTSPSTAGSFLANVGGPTNTTIINAVGTGNLINANVIGMNRGLTFNTPSGSDSVTVSSQLGSTLYYNSANSTVAKIGDGTLFFTGTGIYTKGTSVSGGTLNLTGALTASSITTSVTGIVSEGTTGIISGTGVSFTHGSSGTSILSGTNTYTGATAVTAGALNLTGSLSGGGAITVSGSAGFSESVTGTISGASTFTDNSTTPVTLAGSNTYTGNTVLTAGTLNITGPLTGNTTTSTLSLGTAAGTTVVNVSNNLTLFAITGASIAGSTTVYNQTAGIVNTSPGQFGDTVASIGNGDFNLTGGIFKVNSGSLAINTASNASSTSVAYVGGTGTLDLTSTTKNNILAYAGTSSLTVAPGGTVNAGNGTSIFFVTTNANSKAVLNIAGGNFNGGTGVRLFLGNGTANVANYISLASGTLSLGVNLVDNATSGGLLYASYAGGTLKANSMLTNVVASDGVKLVATSTLFGPIDNSVVTGDTTQNFTGGLTVDTNGFAVTYSNPIFGATATGVTQSSLAVTGGTGYVGAPLVQFTGGTLATNGAPATGYAVINASSGTVTGVVITSPGEYTSAPTVTLTGGGGTGASIAVGTLTANATDLGLTKINSGTLTLTGSNSYFGSTNVSGGTLVLASAHALPTGVSNTGSALTVASGATVQITNHGVAATITPLVNALTNNGTIDLTNNAIVLNGASGSLAAISGQVAAAYNSGAWNGSSATMGVITSSVAASDTTHLTAVGVATGLTTFEGASVSTGDVLLKYTYVGDANLDGMIDGSDYSRIDNGFLTGLTGWYNGDFNYDGLVNGSDYTLIDNAYNTQGAVIAAQLAGPGAIATAQLAGSGATSAVPEPASLGLLGIGAVGLLGRRRRSR